MGIKKIIKIKNSLTQKKEKKKSKRWGVCRVLKDYTLTCIADMKSWEIEAYVGVRYPTDLSSFSQKKAFFHLSH